MRGEVAKVFPFFGNKNVNGRDICAKTRFALLPGHHGVRSLIAR